MRSIACFLLVGVGSLLWAGAADPSEKPDGHTYSLFDGESLSGWTVENDCQVEVQDGLILLKSGNGWLRSDHMYTDFKLHLEWKALQKENYDAGLYVRTASGGRPFPKNSYQINLLEGKEGNISKLRGAASRGLVKPAGQWNSFDVSVVGTTVATTINGQLAYRVAGIENTNGYIGIQVEVPKGGQFLFRNLQVTELRHRSLFKDNKFSEWDGAGQPAELCWRVEKGTLIGLNRKGPWLRSRDEFEDFNLRLEYRVEAGANSGIYVRVPPDGNHHRDDETKPPAGFEVQILDDNHRKYSNLKDYQYCGSVYTIAGATHHVSKPPGQWNTLELNCRGHHITNIHNGVMIVNATLDEYPLLGLRQLRGHLGFQNHGGGVQFRNLRIGPAIELPANP